MRGPYAVHLFYLWVPDAARAVARVRDRVETGGHDVPEAGWCRGMSKDRRWGRDGSEESNGSRDGEEGRPQSV